MPSTLLAFIIIDVIEKRNVSPAADAVINNFFFIIVILIRYNLQIYS